MFTAAGFGGAVRWRGWAPTPMSCFALWRRGGRHDRPGRGRPRGERAPGGLRGGAGRGGPGAGHRGRPRRRTDADGAGGDGLTLVIGCFRPVATVKSVTTGHSGHVLRRSALLRLRARSWPILQTAGAAVAAWYLATLVTSEPQPVFASIAAVISLGATYGQRSERAIELIGGVVLGIGIADLLVRVIGSGPVQLGLMVLLAMAAAVLLGGGALLVTEAAVSATLLVLLDPAGTGLAPSRVIEALVGGGVALAVSALAFPLNPVLLVGRSAQAIFGGLGRTLEDVAAGPRGRRSDPRRTRPCRRPVRSTTTFVRSMRPWSSGARQLDSRRDAGPRVASWIGTHAPRGTSTSRFGTPASWRAMRRGTCGPADRRRRRCWKRSTTSAWPCGHWPPNSTTRLATQRFAPWLRGRPCAPPRPSTRTESSGSVRSWRRCGRPPSTSYAQRRPRPRSANSPARHPPRSF